MERKAQDILKFVADSLGVTRTEIAAMLLVTERSLYDWAPRSLSELPPKGQRLRRLSEVLTELGQDMKKNGLPADKMLAVLKDGRVPVDGDDEETGSMSLISYLTAFPDDHGWRANVKAALDDYVAYTGRNVERRRGAV